MRRILLGAALLAGCDGVTPIGTPSGQVELSVVAAPPRDDDIRVDRLDVVLDELVVDTLGPSGRQSVSVLVDHRFQPLDAIDAVGFWLELGAHRDVSVTVRIGAVGGPGLIAGGSVDGDDGPFVRLEVDEVTLPFRLGALEIREAPIEGRIVLDPGAWISALGLEEEDDDEEQVFVIDSGSGAAYDRVVAAIVASSRLETGPAAATDDDGEDP